MVIRAASRWFAAPALVATLAAQPSFTTVAKGNASGQQTPRQVTIRTPAEWQTLWNAHSPEATLPVVDFSTTMVVGLFLGSRPSDGYDVEVVGVRTQEQDLLVEFVQRRPGRGMMGAQILTEPYHLVAVAKHAGPVTFLHVPAAETGR